MELGVLRCLISLPAQAIKEHILMFVPLQAMLSLSSASKHWNSTTEVVFERICTDYGWRLPRFPRGKSRRCCGAQWKVMDPAYSVQYKYMYSNQIPTNVHVALYLQTLFLQRACRFCGAAGEFGIRAKLALELYVCKPCSHGTEVLKMLNRYKLKIDMESINGKQLRRGLNEPGTRAPKKRKRLRACRRSSTEHRHSPARKTRTAHVTMPTAQVAGSNVSLVPIDPHGSGARHSWGTRAF
jgi:hypothetical protein